MAAEENCGAELEKSCWRRKRKRGELQEGFDRHKSNCSPGRLV
jgi:hypothetical protein